MGATMNNENILNEALTSPPLLGSFENKSRQSTSLIYERWKSCIVEDLCDEDIPADIELSGVSTSEKRCMCYNGNDWAWEPDNESQYAAIENQNLDVIFHRHQSQGTAVVRCSELMSENQYYWEMKVTHPVYGTDVMIGVGTPEVEVKDITNKYVSVLGMDKNSWGLSYTGLFYHDGISKHFTDCFGRGNVVGIHLDLWRGTMAFYKDRKYLGVAFPGGLKGKNVYAMASSTAAYSGMRLVRSCSFRSSLLFMCCKRLREIIPENQNVLDVIDLPPNLKRYLKKSLHWLLRRECPDSNHDVVFHNRTDCENIRRIIFRRRPCTEYLLLSHNSHDHLLKFRIPDDSNDRTEFLRNLPELIRNIQ